LLLVKINTQKKILKEKKPGQAWEIEIAKEDH
jgi:hypothetical protein